MASTVLVVDDEPDLTETICMNLRKAGYIAQGVHTGAEALDLVRSDPLYDLIILDLMLPDLSGIEVCRQIRADQRTAETRVLMLTAKADEIDRVVGFEVGADDYVVKPFSMRELMLRVGALLKRTGSDDTRPTRQVGPIRIDLDAHRVWVDGDEVQLTQLEFRLLATMLGRVGRVQSRSALLEEVWGLHSDTSTRTVDTHVKRLRRKLGSAAHVITTVRGVGYRLAIDQS